MEEKVIWLLAIELSKVNFVQRINIISGAILYKLAPGYYPCQSGTNFAPNYQS